MLNGVLLPWPPKSTSTMKTLLFALLLFPVAPYAQTEQSLLWKVTKDGNVNTSYLFGSMHTNDSLANTFSKEWWNALKSCNALATEVDLTNPKELMASMNVAMMKDTVLADLYSEEEMKEVDAFIKKTFDPFTATFTVRMKPFFILAAAMEKPMEDSPYKMLMDMRLQGIAKDNGKEVIGLETFAQQAASIDVVSLKEQAILLLDYARGGRDMEGELDSIMKHYLAQNLDSLLADATMMDYPEKLMKSLIEIRNARFMVNLLPHLTEKRVFCVVGAMHLVGPTGLIEQLKKNGYLVEPVAFRFGE